MAVAMGRGPLLAPAVGSRVGPRRARAGGWEDGYTHEAGLMDQHLSGGHAGEGACADHSVSATAPGTSTSASSTPDRRSGREQSYDRQETIVISEVSKIP